MTSSPQDVIVVGAGVAGASLAVALARDGRRVLLIERELWRKNSTKTEGSLVEPSRIVGELLQPGGVHALSRLGLSDALHQIDAQPIFGYGIFLDGKSVCLDYTEGASDALDRNREEVIGSDLFRVQANAKSGETRQDIVGSSFHNGRFLRRLRELAVAERNITLVEGNVIALDKDEEGRIIGVSYRTHSDLEGCSRFPLGMENINDAPAVPACDGQTSPVLHARAPLTIACDGCASNLRKRATAHANVQVYSHFVGLVLHIPKLPYPNHGHVVLANQAPVLFYPISSTEVRCLIDVPSSIAIPIDEHIVKYVVPQLPETFRGALLAAVHAGQFKSMPNRVMPAAPAVVPGAVLLGDSFNMRHPLTGGGMTVALSDVDLLRNVLRSVSDLSDLSNVHHALTVFYKCRKPLSSTINILANALYAVFCATKDPALVEMRAACFSYLCAGGRRSYDPIGMLGGIKPFPSLLIFHFFAVALYGCFLTLLPFPTPARIARACSIVRAAYGIVKPLILAENIFPSLAVSL